MYDLNATEIKAVLENLYKTLSFECLIFFDEMGLPSEIIGDKNLAKGIIGSQFLQTIQSQLPIPINIDRKSYDILLMNEKGVIAKEGTAEEYLIGFSIDNGTIVGAISDVDPGMLLYELRQLLKT